MSVYTRVDETSPHRCWDCDKQMVIEVKVSDYDGEASVVHVCPVCFDEVVDPRRQWWLTAPLWPVSAEGRARAVARVREMRMR